MTGVIGADENQRPTLLYPGFATKPLPLKLGWLLCGEPDFCSNTIRALRSGARRH